MKPFHISDPATSELTEAIRWYEEQRDGLGVELFDAISETIDLIRTHPEIGSPRATHRPSRQVRVQRFPYYVVYRTHDDAIYVVAVAHTSRRPDDWKHRS